MLCAFRTLKMKLYEMFIFFCLFIISIMFVSGRFIRPESFRSHLNFCGIMKLQKQLWTINFRNQIYFIFCFVSGNLAALDVLLFILFIYYILTKM